MWHIYDRLASLLEALRLLRKNCVIYYTYRVSYVGQAGKPGRSIVVSYIELFEALENIFSACYPFIEGLNYFENLWICFIYIIYIYYIIIYLL